MARSTNRVRDMKKEEKKKTGRAALLWLLFSVRVWEEGMEGSITFNYGTPTNSIY